MSELTDRLREGGPFITKDGIVSIKILDSKVALQAADRITELERDLADANARGDGWRAKYNEDADKIHRLERLLMLALQAADRITELEAEAERLTILAGYARHDEGCNGPFGMRCKCGYLTAWHVVHDPEEPT